MNATKRAQVPFGLRKKLMAATSMLLVAAIMLVSASYAWFTLSTAPEITGITTSVGANGNLEIALLNTETYDNETLITSNTGDSMETQGEVAANITWGNLIDLSDPSYGLTNIKMYPSALNATDTGFAVTSPLATPEYGADGRVTTMNSTSTTTAIYDGTAFTTGTATDYGVRAVGTSSSISPRQLAFTSAKANYAQAAKSAQAATKSAVSTNANSLLSIATGGAEPTSYTYAQVENMKAIAVGIQSSLNSIVSAYANAIVAAAAADTTNVTDEQMSLLNSTLSGMTNATSLLAAVGNFATVPQKYTADLQNLETAQATVAQSIAMANGLLNGNTTKAEFGNNPAVSDYNDNGVADTTDITNGMASPLVGGKAGLKAYDSNNGEVTISVSDINKLINEAKYIYIGAGAVNTVASYTGSFKITEALGIGVYAGVNKNATGVTEVNKLSAVTTTVNGLNPTFGAGAANISDFYGYIIDFAFRTNAASSNLLLQTEAVNRVYSDATADDRATMGSGSFGTFDYTGLTFEQGKNLLESYRVVFFNPADGTIYGTAKFGDIPTTATEGSTTITGKLQLISTTTTVGKYTLGQDAYEVETTGAEGAAATYKLKADFKVGEEVPSAANCTNYVATGLTATDYEDLAKTTVKADDVTTDTFTGGNALTSLPQNQAKKVSMLVYLDGNNIDNAAVNAVGSSGSLDLNVQFASDANLVPMENSALKNKTVTAEGGEGN